MIKINEPPVLWACLSLSVLVVCAYLLITGSPWLVHTVVESINLPLGTLVSWAAIVALPSTIYLATATHLGRSKGLSRFCRYLLMADLVVAGSWGLVAYGLAGNWAFTFSGRAPSFRGSDDASLVFWAYSTVIVLLALIVVALLLARKVVSASKSGISA